MRADFAGFTRLRGHAANLTPIYPTLGLGPKNVPQRSDIFPMGGIWRDLSPGSLDSRGFWRGDLDESGFRRIYGTTRQMGPNLPLTYPTLGLGPGHVLEVGHFHPMEGFWRDLNPGSLNSRGFRRGVWM